MSETDTPITPTSDQALAPPVTAILDRFGERVETVTISYLLDGKEVRTRIDLRPSASS